MCDGEIGGLSALDGVLMRDRKWWEDFQVVSAGKDLPPQIFDRRTPKPGDPGGAVLASDPNNQPNDPGTGGFPNDPNNRPNDPPRGGRPTDPVVAGMPIDPNDRFIPVDPNRRTVPVDPNKRAVPVDPVVAGLPNDPNQGGLPADPNKRAVPVDPVVAGLPNDPNTGGGARPRAIPRDPLLANHGGGGGLNDPVTPPKGDPHTGGLTPVLTASLDPKGPARTGGPNGGVVDHITAGTNETAGLPLVPTKQIAQRDAIAYLQARNTQLAKAIGPMGNAFA